MDTPAGGCEVCTPQDETRRGIAAPSEKIPLENLSFFDPKLNDNQKAAVKLGLESPELACIHGPPGIISVSLTETSNPNPVPQELENPWFDRGYSATNFRVLRKSEAIAGPRTRCIRFGRG